MIRRKTLECGTLFVVLTGDITAQATDAIVNAANSRLAGGGGVDGAIHAKGGPEIMAECRKFGGCPTGYAVVTGAGRLKAKHVIHAVGPIYSGLTDDARLLALTYKKSLECAVKSGCKSVSFPSISTGAYGYPPADACPIAMKTCHDFVNDNPVIEEIHFVLFSDPDFALYVEQLEELK